jgi:hypothetical protein
VFEGEIKDLIASAFKSQIKEIRNSMKILKIVKNRSSIDETLSDDYREGLKIELISKANRLLSIIRDYCLPNAALNGYIFFVKLMADIYRYMADACLGL